MHEADSVRDQDIARFVVSEFGRQAKATSGNSHGKVTAVASGLYSVEVDGKTRTGLSASVGTYRVGDWVTVARMGGGSQAFQIIGQSSFMGDSNETA